MMVGIENFLRAETARVFDGSLSAGTAAFNGWAHVRAPTSVDRQPVIRMNRDTLYSGALVNISAGAAVTLPEVGDRYMSVMVINEDNYLNRVLVEPGVHELTMDEFDTPFVALAARVFVDPDDHDDVATVNELQDAMTLTAGSSEPYEHPEYDEASLTETRDALLVLARGLPDTRRMFGARDDVDQVRHLIGTASAWGDLPENEAFYFIHYDPQEVGHYQMKLRHVPVDAFWSFTVYNRDGYFESNPSGTYSVNSVTAQLEPDGSVVVDLAPTDDGYRNHVYVMDGWNYALRLYRPRPEVLDGPWIAPVPEVVE